MSTFRRNHRAKTLWAGPPAVLLAGLVGIGAGAAGHGGCTSARSTPGATAPSSSSSQGAAQTTAVPPSAVAAAPPATAAKSADVRESIVARSIFADSAGTVVLFAEVHRCTAEPSLPSGQVFVSTDTGRTFSKRGPELEGCSFDLALSTTAGQLWVVGLHTAEGPGVDPFLLVPRAGLGDLVRHPVREGPAEIVGAARGRQGDLLVWLRDISAVGATRGKRAYESRDEGVTWKESTRPSTAAGLTHFTRLGRRSGAWRIADLSDGGFDIQRLTAKAWQSVAHSPGERAICVRRVTHSKLNRATFSMVTRYKEVT